MNWDLMRHHDGGKTRSWVDEVAASQGNQHVLRRARANFGSGLLRPFNVIVLTSPTILDLLEDQHCSTGSGGRYATHQSVM